MAIDSYERALMATIELHKFIAVGNDECAEAEKLRDEMDVLLRHLTAAQKKMVQQLSADLWDVREGVCLESDDPSFGNILHIFRELEHEPLMVLKILSDGRGIFDDFTRNTARGLIWTRLGYPLVAAVFFGAAVEAAFEKEGE